MKKIIVPKPKNKKEHHYCELCNVIDMKAHKAAMLGHIPCLELSQKQKPKLFKLHDANGATPIHLAARENQIRAFRWLISNTDLQTTERAKNGETPSHVAAAQGNLDMLKLIINFDLNYRLETVTLYDKLGFTPLKLAILRDHPVILEWLLEEFGTAAFGDPAKSEESDVHICSALGHLSCLKVLLKFSPSLANLTVDDGTTPVYYSAQEGRLHILEYLVGTLGCSPGVRAKDGMTALHAAAQNGHTRVVKYLIEKLGREAILGQTGDGATPIHFAASKGHIDTLRWLLDHDKSKTGVKVTDEVGGTPAHDAADNGELECLTLLVERGADIFAEDLNKSTPYLLGLECGNDEVKSYLRKLAMSLGRLPGSRIVSAKASRRGSVTLETREGEDIEVITQKETEEVRTSRLSFDAMKYATKVEEKLESIETPKDSDSEADLQPESQDGALTTVLEVQSKETLDTESTEKQSTPSVLEEEVKAELSLQRSARRSQGGPQNDIQKTPSLYTSQDLSGDDFFDLDKLEKEIDEMNKKFNEMQSDWNQTKPKSDAPQENETLSRRDSRHIVKNVIPQYAPIHSPPVVKKEVKTQIQQIEIEFKTETGPASSRREQSRNLKKKLGEGIPGLSDYLDEDTGSDSSGTVTPDESESNHSSQVDLNEHPLMPISEEISPYETKKKKSYPDVMVTQRKSFVGEISQAEVHLEKELTEEELKERSGKGKFVIFSDTTHPKERRPTSTGETLEGLDVGHLSDEAIMGLYARMDPSKKRQVLEALIREAREVEDTEDLKKENEIVQGLQAKVASVQSNSSIAN